MNNKWIRTRLVRNVPCAHCRQFVCQTVAACISFDIDFGSTSLPMPQRSFATCNLFLESFSHSIVVAQGKRTAWPCAIHSQRNETWSNDETVRHTHTHSRVIVENTLCKKKRRKSKKNTHTLRDLINFYKLFFCVFSWNYPGQRSLVNALSMTNNLCSAWLPDWSMQCVRVCSLCGRNAWGTF